MASNTAKARQEAAGCKAARPQCHAREGMLDAATPRHGRQRVAWPGVAWRGLGLAWMDPRGPLPHTPYGCFGRAMAHVIANAERGAPRRMPHRVHACMHICLLQPTICESWMPHGEPRPPQ